MTIGARIRLVRDLLGETQTQLADEVGFSQPTWARIEAGTAEPGDKVINWLSSRSGLPVSFFNKNASVATVGESGSIRYREHSRLTKRERDRATALAKLSMEALMSSVDRGVNLPPLRLPAPDAIVGRGIEAAAELTRGAMELDSNEPIGHLTRRLEKAGVRILSLPVTYEQAKVNRGVDAFSDWFDGEAVIATSQHAPGDRQRMSLAHEVGHLVLHTRAGDEKRMEREAMEFGSALLMPRDAFLGMLPSRHMTVSDLAVLKRHWRVSMAAAVMRAARLGAIDEGEKRRLFRVLSARGWRRSEPIPIPHEHARLLKSSLVRAFRTDRIARLAKELDISPTLLSGLLDDDTDHASTEADGTVRYKTF